MTDTRFETMLAGQLRDYADGGVRPFDRYSIADATIARAARTWGGRRIGLLVGLALLVVGLVAAIVVGSQRGPDRFLPSGRMVEPRSDATAVTLQDGRVLLIGGWTDDGPNQDDAGGLYADAIAQPTIEIWDPADGTSRRAGLMQEPRVGATATVLADGRVLIAGGDTLPPTMLHHPDRGVEASYGTTSAELFDPVAGTLTPVGSMTRARAWHSATLLGDGRVLLAGGATGSRTQPGDAVGPFEPRERPTASAELFDPTTGTFSAVGPLSDARQGQAAIRLQGGRVLIVGGRTIWDLVTSTEYRPVRSIEIYDPATGLFTRMETEGAYVAAAALPDGRVLLVGPDLDGRGPRWDVFDPTVATFSRVDAGGRAGDIAVASGDGRILVANRFSYEGPRALDPAMQLSVFDPMTGLVTDAGPTSFSSSGPSMAALLTGDVLLAGGDRGTASSSDETVVFQTGRSFFDERLP